MLNFHLARRSSLWTILLIACSYLSPHQQVSAKDLALDKIEQLSTQAETAYSANQYQKAINLWLKIIEKKPNPLSQPEIALVQLNIASTLFRIGNYGEAVRSWQKAIEIYRDLDSDRFLAASLVDQARAYLALGQTDLASKRLNEALKLIREKTQDIQAENNLAPVLATAYLTLGNINILQGKDLQAEKNYRSSFEYTSTAQEKTVAQNNLSRLFWARAQNPTLPQSKTLHHRRLALEAAQKAVNLSNNVQSLATVDALLQLVRVSDGENNNLDYYLKKAEIILAALPNSTRKVYTLINLSGHKQNPVATLKEAETIAGQIKDLRAQSFALGHLGNYYEHQKQYQKALEWTNQARLAAQSTQADDSLYRWEWQAGRIYTMLAQTDRGIEAYESAVASLQRIRRELAIEQEKQIDFELEIEPVYRELIQLLLANNPTPEHIKQALDFLELLQLSELEHFFKDDCLELISEQRFRPENKMGLIHTIILPEATYLILQTQQNIKNIKIDIASGRIKELVQEWRSDLETRENDNYLFSGQQLYDLLIKPIESELISLKIETLIFVNDGILRNVPPAALYDGQEFLVKKYAVGVSLGLNLQIKQIQPKKNETKILAFGLSEETEAFPALPYVQKEIELLNEVAEVQQFLNSEFIANKMEKELMTQNFPLVHIATHGQFNGTLEESFLETYQGQINLLDLENILSSHQINFPANPLELLTLSACETAAGNRRATLGLAGVAIRSGVSNVLASLWSIDDEQAVVLMSDFYHALLKQKMSQFEALRQAQMKMISDPNSHPTIWSNLILIVN